VRSRGEHRPVHGGTRHDGPWREQGLRRHPDAAGRAVHRACRWPWVLAGQDRPLRVVQAELGIDRDQVHVRVVEAVQRPDVAPVPPFGLPLAWDVVVPEVVHPGLVALDEHRHDAPAHVVLAVRVPRVAGQRLDEHARREHVVAHRGEHLVRGIRQAAGVGRLLPERRDPPAAVVDLDHPELVGHRQGLADGGDSHAGTGLDVLSDHLPRVHPVDVVRAEDDDVPRPLVTDQVHALVDRIRRPGEPARAQPLLRRHGGDVVAEQRGQPPGLADVPVQGMALVLGQHHQLEVAAVDQVGQDEVDHAVHAAERHRRLGPVRSQWHQPLALATGQHHREHVSRHDRGT
jgi:hypothetical protein